tara:strand:+ start:60 stop:302 length:243 start_codon:yes stop_codon:yes gene_type:complete
MYLVILRCGHCGKFCDNTGRKFKATKQLIAADTLVGFLDAMGECSSCRPSLADHQEEAELNNKLSEIRGAVNKKLSTGNY